MSKTQRNIAIVASMPQVGYSGGRYHTLMMARALAFSGHDVTVITNNFPTDMWEDLESLESDKRIRFSNFGSNYSRFALNPTRFDFVFCVPDSGFSWVYVSAISLAASHSSKLGFINFETPNWLNSLSPYPRSTWFWIPWKLTASLSAAIISSSSEATRYAKNFYSVGENSAYLSIPPSVNTNEISKMKAHREEGFRVFMPTRIKSGSHKGINDFETVLSKLSHPCKVVINADDIGDPRLKKIKANLEERSIEVKLMTSITERQKFEEYAKASITVFPSYFEGFGYPPIESILCGTPCIAYDLPVIKEVTRDTAIFARLGDPMEMASYLNTLQTREKLKIETHIRRELMSFYSLGTFAERLESIFGATKTSDSLRNSMFMVSVIKATLRLLSSFDALARIAKRLLLNYS